VFELKNGQTNLINAPLCLCSNHKQSLNFFQTLNIKSSKSSTAGLPLNKLAKALILFYQATFSYFLGGNCRFYPSCSHYASEAFSKHSFFKAFILTVRRLLSCHPFTKRSVFDPVPLPAQEKREIV